VPTWNVEHALQGQIRLPDGSYGGRLFVTPEVEGAIAGLVRPENIVRAGKVTVTESGRHYVQATDWVLNPNFTPPKR
jgi:hypothetical protein